MNKEAILKGIKDDQGYNNQNNYDAHEAVKRHAEQGWEWYGKNDFETYEEYLKNLVENEDWEANGLEDAVKTISKFYR